jgi:type IV pilus assembly protein PilE
MNWRREGTEMKKRDGFTLIELIVTVSIVAILATYALPSFTTYIRKARRTDVQQILLGMANEQALWRSNNTSYATYANLGSPTDPYYSPLQVTGVSAIGFALTATATATGGQAADNERGTSCTTLTYALAGTIVAKTPIICWER